MSQGSIIKREGKNGAVSYLLKWEGERDPATGKRIQRYKTVRGTKKEAQAELRRLLGAVDNGTAVDPNKITVGEWLTNWLRDYVKPNLSLRTYECYKGNLETYVIPVLGAVRLQKLTSTQIQKLLVDLQKNGKGRYGKQPERKEDAPEVGLSPQSALHVHRNLYAALKEAANVNLIPQNPSAKVKAPKVRRKRATEAAGEDCGPIHALDQDQVETLLKSLKGKHIYPLAVLALGTGARRGELLALRWSDVNLDKKTITINRAVESTKEGGIRIKPPKNETSRRTITVDEDLCGALRNHRQTQEEMAQQLGILCPADGLVFPMLIRRSRGRQPINPIVKDVDFTRPWNPDYPTKEFHREATLAGFPEFRFHDMRHTHATALLTAGVPPHIVAGRLGHSTPVITMMIYAHVLPRGDEQAAKIMGQMMRAALGSSS